MVTAHSNNFNIVRLFAATQVLLVHSFNHNFISNWAIEALKATPGVPIFFFISGYLITLSYLRTSKKGIPAFFRNRALRIYPALVVCVLFATSMVGLSGYLAQQDFTLPHFLFWVTGQMTFLQFYNPDFMRSFGAGVINGALWTITVELQFYLLTPILVWLFQRSKSLTTVLFALSVLGNLYLAYIGGERTLIDKLFTVSFLPWVFMFMTGMFAASVPSFAQALRRGPLILLALLYIGSMFALGGYKLNAQNSINPVSFLLLAAMVFKVAHLAIPYLKSVQRFLDRNDFSYGIYLYHMPIINLLLYISLPGAMLSIVISIIVTIVLAIFSWYAIEKPSLSYKG